jgi:hypothetical protein
MALKPQDLILTVANLFAGALDYAEATERGVHPLSAMERAYVRACRRAKALAGAGKNTRRVIDRGAACDERWKDER